MKKLMKMFVMLLLFKACTLSYGVSQGTKPIHLAVIVDTSPTSEYNWQQIKTFAAKALNSLESDDRIEIYSAKKDSTALHLSSIAKQTSDTVVFKCLEDIDQIFFLDKADIAKSAEFVFETFKISSQNFDCCLLVISDGKIPANQIRQLKRVLSAYKMRNWPVMLATFDDADKDIFRSGAANEFTVTLIKNDWLKLWLDKTRIQSLQKLLSESKSTTQEQTPKPVIVTPMILQPVTKEPQTKKNETIAQPPVKIEPKIPVKQEVTPKPVEKKDNIPSVSKQLSQDTVTDIELKNQQTLTAKIKSATLSVPIQDSNTVKTTKITACDVNSLKNVSKKSEANKPVEKVVKAALPDSNKPENKLPKKPIRFKFNKKMMLMIPLLLLTVFFVYYISQKLKAGRNTPVFNTEPQENTNLKLMAIYNGTEYELGDPSTITNLEIGSHPGSTIPIEADGVDERLFAIKTKKGSFYIKNLSGQVLTVNSSPLASNEKRQLILPAEIRYNDKVSIQLYQLSQDEINSEQNSTI
ncbi:MAG: hypothetical protein ABFD79_06255 [Phycisphaerales bacterium]